jgi:membrane protein DedA with SNARE-associated domain
VAAIAAYLVFIADLFAFAAPGEVGEGRAIFREMLRIVQGWGAIVGLIGLADRFLNRDLPIRATLTEAVFPFYIIHQTIIVLVGWWLLPTGIGNGAAFLALTAATVAGCAAFYWGGRRIPPLRPLIGLTWRNKLKPKAA